MATCTINKDQFLFAYEQTKNAIQDSLDKRDSFDAVNYMKYFYNDVVDSYLSQGKDRREGKERAAEWIAELPSIIDQVIMRNFQDDITKFTNFGQLYKYRAEFSKDGVMLKDIIKIFDKLNTANKDTQKNSRKRTSGSTSITGSTQYTDGSPRLTSRLILSTTLPIFKPNKSEDALVDEVDEERAQINKVLTFIMAELNNQSGVVGPFIYQGSDIMLKAVNADTFTDPNTKEGSKNLAKLDTQTQKDFAKSRKMMAEGKAKASVTQINERVLLIVTDSQGNPISFDKDGKITAKEEGRYVFQFLRDIKKKNGKFQIKDIYGIADTVDINATLKNRIKLDKSRTAEQHEKDVQEELEFYFALKEKALKEDVLVDMVGITQGVDPAMAKVEMTIDELKELGKITMDNIANIETLNKPEEGMPVGASKILVGETWYMIDRMRMPADIADQITEVLFSEKIKIKKKLEFIDQFIPENNDIILSYLMRRHKIVPDPNGNFIDLQVYKKVGRDKEVGWRTTSEGTEELLFEIRIDKSGKVEVLNEMGEVPTVLLESGKAPTYKEAFRKALVMAYIPPNAGATFIHYPSSLLTNADQFELYDIEKGKFYEGYYYDFIKDSKVQLRPATESALNQQLIFKLPNDVSEFFKNSEKPPIDKNKSAVQKTVNEIISEVFESKDLFDFSDNQPGKVINGEFIPENLGEQLFNAINNVLQGKVVAVYDQKKANALFKKFAKTVHPDKNLGELSSIVADSFFKAMNVAKEQGRVDILNDLKKKFDVEIKKVKELEQEEEKPKSEPNDAAKNKKSVENEIESGPDTNKGAFESGGIDEEIDPSEFERSGKLKNDNVTPEEIAAAEKWWSTSPLGKALQKYITLNRAANIVNSDAYANFVVNMSKLANPDMLGTINLNTKGTMVDIYHEAFHGFTQLFLTIPQKKALYNEVMNYTDKNGNQPYLLKSAREIEEILAEDFRTYMKNQTPKKDAPVRNSIFRQILNFLKRIFKVFRGKNAKAPSVKDVTLDIMSIPAVKELYENLRMGSPEFLNKYQASIDNARFFYLERGPQFVEKLGKEKNKRQALSAQDGKLVVESMDSLISDIIDQIYRQNSIKGGNIANHKGVTLSMLLNPRLRSVLYKAVKRDLVKRHSEIAEDWSKSTDNKFAISQISPEEGNIKAIQDSAIAVLEKEDGRKKYIFLRSQIDTFKDLNPNLKEERVKGEKYYDISITGDYFVHKTIRNAEGEPGFAEIIVVSDVNDARKQYDNYKKAKAKYKTITVDQWAKIYENVEKRKPKNLTAKQEVIFNNLRILSAAIDQFGDPDYMVKGEAPTGMIAYHVKNSDFGIGRLKYTDSEIDQDDTGSVDSESIDPEFYDNKKSTLQLADKEVVYILKSLHLVKRNSKGKPVLDKNGNPVFVKNQLGFKQKNDFRRTWNVISKSIQGIQSRKEAYDRLVKESELYPELKQLIESKLPEPGDITNRFAEMISGSFFKTFAKPQSEFTQLTVYQSTDEKSGEIKEDKNGNPLVHFAVKRSSADIRKVMLQFQSYFKMALSPYIKLTDQYRSILDMKKLLTDLSDLKTLKQQRAFLLALGIRLDNTEQIDNALASPAMRKQVNEILTFVKSMNILSTKKADEMTDGEKRLLNAFISDPVDVMKRKGDYLSKGMTLPLYNENLTDLRVDNNLEFIAGIQSKFGFDSPGETVKLPDGNKAYSVVNHMSVTSLLDALNNVESLTDTWESEDYKSYTGHLKPSKNFFINRSKYIDSVFARGGRRTRKQGRMFKLITIAGSEIYDTTTGIEKGLNTADLTAIDKFYQEFNIALTKGIFEFVRHAEKKLAYAVVPSKKQQVRLDDGTRATDDNSNLWIDIDRFDTELGDRIGVEGFILDQIATEFDRIKFFSQNPDVLLRTEGYNKPLVSDPNDFGGGREGMAKAIQKDFKNGNLSGQNFTFMDDLLSEEVKKELLQKANDPEFDVDIVEDIKDSALFDKIYDSVVEYFNIRETEIFEDYLSKVPYEFNSKLFGFINDKEYTGTRTVESVIRAYLYNDWISKFEMFNLINGDGAQFDHAKEAGTKRVPGSTSNGDSFLFDIDAQKFMSNVSGFNSKTYSSINYDKNLTFNGTLNTAVIDDPIRMSNYLDDMIEAWTNDYRRAGLSEAKIKKAIANDSKPYREMQEADGAAFLDIDSYRMLKFLGSEWGVEQENLYQDIIAGKEVDSRKINEFFPVYKLHYYGPITNAEINTTAMFKFAVAPIIPTVAKPGSELHALHEKMIKDSINMMVFSSGSKVSFLTQEEGKIDNIFNETDRNNYRTVNQDAKLRINQIHVRYLKDVTKVSKTLKDLITLGTQDRVISLSTLFDMGVYLDEAKKQLGDEYISAVEGLTDIYEEELLEKIGFKFNENTGKYEGNVVDLIELIKNDLELKGISEQLISMLDLNFSGHLKRDFSVIPVADVIESIIVTKISKAIVSQKTKGEAMVQVPSTFYNGVWENIQKNEANRKKYLGDSVLRYYLRGEVIGQDKDGFDIYADTDLAQVAIPFNGDWVNLLNLEWNGSQIGTLERLNQLIKDQEFLKVHRDKLTITGPRIPTDAINLKEAFEVYHFIDASAGSTVVVPTEIVAKAGSDFDIDKIFFSFPNIEKDGSLTKAVPNFKEKIKEFRRKGKSVMGLIQQQKRFSQNEWIRTSANIIRDGSNYASLTKPTDAYLLEDEVKRIYGNLSNVYNPSRKNVHSSRTNSPTRLLEAAYNLNKHKELLGGMRPLGILAKASKRHELYKSIGAKFPKTFNFIPNQRYLEGRYVSDITRDFVLHFDHKKTKQDNISLGSYLNVDGEVIGTVISHWLQAVLDRSNKTIASKANITKESLPVLLRLIESGVSKEQALAFVNQPLILDYLEKKSENAGFIKKAFQGAREAAIFDTFSKSFSGDTLKVYQQALDYSNRKRLIEVYDDLKLNNPNLKMKIYFSIIRKDANGNAVAQKFEKTYKNYKDFADNFTGNPDTLKKIEVEVPVLSKSKRKEFVEVFKEDFATEENAKLSAIKYQNYYISEYLWKEAFGTDKVTASELEGYIGGDINTVEQLALLAHYFQIEDQSQGMAELEQVFNPDTTDVDTLVGVETRALRLEALQKPGNKIDPETLRKLIEESVIASTYKTKLYKDVTEPLFDLRLDQKVLNFITDTLIKDKYIIAEKYGYKERDRSRFVNYFNNTLIDFIYQNTISNFTDENQLPVQLPETIGDRTVEKFKGTILEPIKITDTKIKIDLDTLESIWGDGNKSLKSKLYLDNATKGAKFSFSTRGLDTFPARQNPFDTLDSFVRYMVQKEILYQEYSESDFATKKAYEEFISKKALSDTFNAAYIKGTTKYSYTRDVLDIIKKNQDLLNFYPVLKQFGESFIGRNILDEKKGGLSLLELKDKNIIDAVTSQIYYQNLKDLGNKDITKKTDGANTSDEISEVFEKFSLMMFYQQGIGRSQLSFSNILDGEQFSTFMTKSVNGFMSKVFADSNAQNLDNLLVFIKEAVLKPKGYKRYLKPYDEFLGKNIDANDLLPTETGIKTLDKIASDYNRALLVGNTTEADSLLERYFQLKFEIDEAEKKLNRSNQPIDTDIEDTINIYYTANENAELSNFEERPFEIDGSRFNTVEGYFQSRKLDFSTEANDRTLLETFKKAKGVTAKRLGSTIKGLKTKEWDSVSERIMKEGIKASFEQNPGALQKLLDTGNATLTHTQDKTKWGKLFPKILMEVREELRTADPVEEKPEIQVSSTIQSLYDQWSDIVKRDVGMTVEQLQEEYNRSKRYAKDLTEESYMDTKWNNCQF